MRALALTLALAAPQAHALGADDPEGLVAALKELGYEAALSQDEMGNPVIDPNGSAVFPWLIFFDRCDDGPCRDMRFVAWTDIAGVIDMEYANDWNSYDGASRLFIMSDGTPRVQMAIPEAAGISLERFAALVRRFEEDSVYGLFVALEGL